MVPDLEGIVSRLQCSAEGATLRFPASIDLTEASETVLARVPPSTKISDTKTGQEWKDATKRWTRIFKGERGDDAAQ